MLGLVKSSDFAMLLDFVSPSFFDVLPPRALWSQGRRLIASRRDARGFAHVLEEAYRALERTEAPIELVSTTASLPDDRSMEPRLRGHAVLTLYFAQLAHCDRVALDLRPARFGEEAGRLLWQPKPASAAWDPEFLAAVRDLYAGFYRDDEARFDRGVVALSLEPARDLLRDQFGDGDQSAVRFELQHFKRSFHAIFVRCQEHGIRIHADFVGLGVYLGALYQHLSTVGVPLDVRSAFEAAWID